MKNTTLCYIEKDGQYLMLHRTKKENDLNHDKWIGVGGKFEENESPEECLLRGVQEETGLTLTEFRLCSVITFLSDRWEGEYMYLFHATDYTGTLSACSEGELVWVEKEKAMALPTWEGDRLFLRRMADASPFFTLKLRYEGDVLKEAVLNGRENLLKD